MWIERKKDYYIVHIYPKDYQRFFKIIGTNIKRKKYLIEFSIEITNRYYIEEVKGRDEWWMICIKLQKAIGRSIKKKQRRNPQPPL